MAAKAGVWIDHKQAIVVLVTDAGHEVRKIAFDIGQPVRSAGRSPTKNRYTPRDYIAEDRLEQKVENDRKDYFNDVLASISEAKSILVLGPGEAKGEFNGYIQSKKLRGVTVDLATADKLTDRQLVAKVVAYFAETADRKPAAPKKSVKKKAVSATAGKPAKKVKKK